MSIPSRRPSARRDGRAADGLSDVLVDLEPPIRGREDRNPWRPAFEFHIADECSEAPGGAEDDLAREDHPPPPHASRTKGSPPRAGS